MNKEFTPNVILGSHAGDYIAGANIDTPEVVNEASNWEDFPSEHERQNEDFETSNCTNFSINDSKEPLSMFKAHNGDIPAEHNKWLKDNGYPSGFQVLCMNCNHAKYRNGGVLPESLKGRCIDYPERE